MFSRDHLAETSEKALATAQALTTQAMGGAIAVHDRVDMRIRDRIWEQVARSQPLYANFRQLHQRERPGFRRSITDRYSCPNAVVPYCATASAELR